MRVGFGFGFFLGGGGEGKEIGSSVANSNLIQIRIALPRVGFHAVILQYIFFSNFNSFRRLFVIVVAAGGCSVATFPQFTRRWLRNAVEIEPLFQTPTWMKSN